MTLHLSRLPFCSVSPAVASGGVAGSTVHAIFVAAPSLPTTPAFGCCTAVVSASSVLPRRKKLFCNGYIYLGLVIVLCALSTAFPVDETVQTDGCKQTDKARELCLAWHHRATGLGSSRGQLQPANGPTRKCHI